MLIDIAKGDTKINEYLNTSHVNVNRFLRSYYKGIGQYLNTSHVNVNHVYFIKYKF